MLRWHIKALEAAEDDREEPKEWEPPKDLNKAWSVWMLLSSTGWRHLLEEGGLLDQPESLMDDVAIVEWLSGIVEPLAKTGHKRRRGLE